MFMVYVVTLLGLMVGSALNAMIWRIFVGKSWLRGRSMCPDCEHQLASHDLVPVVSWLWLKGKCRYCGKRIHWQYPAVELLTAALFGLSAVLMPSETAFEIILLFCWLAILGNLIVLAVYDLRWLILPDKILLPAIGMALLYRLLNVLFGGSWLDFGYAVLAAFLAGGAFYLIAAISRGRAMGGGDIKLAFFMGLLLGFAKMIVAMEIAFATAAAVGIILILLKIKKRKDHIPFGPFLVGGTIISFFQGEPIIEWYLRINGL